LEKGKDFLTNGPILARRPRHSGVTACSLGPAQRQIQARLARPHGAHPRHGHHALGECHGAAAVGKPGNEVWRRQWVKLKHDEGEVSGIVREARAHHVGERQRGGGV
jgi:hypothetical protein